MIRLYIHDIARANLLGRKDPRSIRKWCDRNNVLIVDDGTNSFVNQADFEIAYNKPITEILKKQHPDDWEQHYRYYNEGNINGLIRMRHNNHPSPIRPVNDININRVKKYVPGTQSSKKLLKEFLNG